MHPFRQVACVRNAPAPITRKALWGVRFAQNIGGIMSYLFIHYA